LATVLIIEEQVDPKTARGFCVTRRPTSPWISTPTRRTRQKGKFWNATSPGWCS